MFTCYECKLIFPSTSDLIKHIRLSCNKFRNDHRCGEPGCIRHFSTIKSLCQHLNRNHVTKSTINLDNNVVTGSNKNENTVASTPNNFPENTMASTSQHNFPMPSTSHDLPSVSPLVSSDTCTDAEKQLANFLSSIYSKTNVPRNIVQIVSREVTNLLSSSKESILNRIYGVLCEQNIEIGSELKSVLENVFDEYYNGLSKFTSEYRRFKFFENLGTFIKPTEFQVGQRMELSGGLNSVPVTMQVIAISDVLKQLLLIPGIMGDILTYLENLKDQSSSIENIMQGTVWKNILKKLGNNDRSLNLPLILFFDDFEIGNPLGSHSGIHKLGGIYLSLPFLPVRYVSQLNNILMLGLFHESDRIAFGNNIIFQKVFDQLNHLKTNGITIQSQKFNGTIKFHVVCLTGDNLGLNSVLGFVESFVANRFCRICIANKDEMKTMLFEDKNLMRNKDNYENDLNLCNPTLTGIKERCTFIDNLRDFDMFEQVAVDPLHDFLEGTCRYVLNYLVTFLVIESKLVPLSIIQNKIKLFDYGADSNSKPLNCIVPDGNNVKIRTSAAEMLTLVRYFGVIIGYYVPNNCEPWELYLYLRRILDRLLNPIVSEEGSLQLKFWVAGLNELYLKLTKTFLKPKFHFMVHYPHMMLKFGLLTQVWTMRFEAKHRVSKIAARSTSCKVNICKTVALKNQLVLNDIFIKSKSVDSVITGKKTAASPRLPVSELENHDFNNKDQYNANWVKITGHKIGISSIVTVDLCTETFQPVFGKVLKIYVVENHIFFHVSLYESIGFDSHFFAYKVCSSLRSMFINSDSLLSVVPNTLTLMRSTCLYITLRMPID